MLLRKVIQKIKRDVYPAKSKYEKGRKRKKKEKALCGAELGIENILPFINKHCEEVLKEIFVSGVEQDIDINCSSTKNTNEGLIKKEEEEEETKKEEESLKTPLANIAKKDP